MYDKLKHKNVWQTKTQKMYDKPKHKKWFGEQLIQSFRE